MPEYAPSHLDLQRIAERVPMYRILWDRLGFKPDARIRAWQQIPVLSKQQLREFSREERLDLRFAETPNIAEHSGGSTGEPVEFLIDPRSRRRRQWRFLKALVHAGYRPGQRLWIVSTHRQSRMNRLARWTYVDLRSSEAQLARRYLDERPQVLYGPLRALLALAEELPRTGLPRPQTLVATAELLRPQDQRALQDGFGVEAADFYGMTEIGLYAYRCAGQPYYRLATTDLHSEFLPCESDPGLERLVVTTLRDCAMPLVRYDTGDLVRRDPAEPERRIVEFVGREIDGILMPDGKHLSPYRLTLALEGVPGISRFQIVQREDLSIDVLVAAAGDIDTTVSRARRAVAAVVGPGLTVRSDRYRPADSLAEKFRPVRSYARR